MIWDLVLLGNNLRLFNFKNKIRCYRVRSSDKMPNEVETLMEMGFPQNRAYVLLIWCFMLNFAETVSCIFPLTVYVWVGNRQPDSKSQILEDWLSCDCRTTGRRRSIGQASRFTKFILVITGTECSHACLFIHSFIHSFITSIYIARYIPISVNDPTLVMTYCKIAMFTNRIDENDAS